MIIGLLIAADWLMPAKVNAAPSAALTCRVAGQSSAALLTVDASALVECLRAMQPVNWQYVRIQGDVVLTDLVDVTTTQVEINVPISIVYSTFQGTLLAGSNIRPHSLTFLSTVNFKHTTFASDAIFAGTEFRNGAGFIDATFLGQADFTQASFANGASFVNTDFEGQSSFLLADFAMGADFTSSQFKQPAIFSMAQFETGTDAVFLDTHFESQAWFDKAHFGGTATFSQAGFAKNVSFNQTKFQQGANFGNADFTGVAVISLENAESTVIDLENVKLSPRSLNLNNTEYERLTDTTFDVAFLDTRAASPETYTQLENNFRAQGQLSLANDVLYQQNVSEREPKPGLLQLLELVFLDWPFGYGVKPWHTLLASVILILVFAAFYYSDGVIRLAPLAPPKPRERKFAIRLRDLPLAREGEFPNLESPMRKPCREFPRLNHVWQAILFSFSVFTKMGWGERVATRRTKIVILEWLIGLVMIAGFFYTLTNTVPLLNALLKAMF